METSNLLEAEFRTLGVRIPNKVRARVDELSEIENIKREIGRF